MINEILRLSKEYQVNAEDILFIHMSRYGVNVGFLIPGFASSFHHMKMQCSQKLTV